MVGCEGVVSSGGKEIVVEPGVGVGWAEVGTYSDKVRNNKITVTKQSNKADVGTAKLINCLPAL